MDDMLGERHAALAISERKAFDISRCITMQNRRRTVDAFAPVTGVGIVDGHPQVAVLLIDTADGPVGLLREVTAGERPIGGVLRSAGGNCNARRISGLGHRQLVELRLDGEAQHQGVAALKTQFEVYCAVGSIDQTDVPWRFLGLVVVLRFVLVIVAVVFEFEYQRWPRGLILHAAKKSAAAVKISTGAEFAALPDIDDARIKALAQKRKRIFHTAACAGVTPAQTEAPVERPGAFAADEVFA